MSGKFAALALLMAAGGCATSQIAPPIDHPPNLDTSAPTEPRGLHIQGDGDAIALAFSGGGARAAAFSLGVLEGLQEMPDDQNGALLDHVRFVSGVSGGSIMAAYYGQHGREGLKDFRASYLDQDWDKSFHTNAVSPANWLRVLKGGLNGSGDLSAWLDEKLYHGATIGDLWANDHPRVLINATELYTGAPFAFSQPYFDAICSDLASVKVSDAVAASMAVPVAFHPVTIATHPDKCAAPLADWVPKTSADRQGTQLLRVTSRAFAWYRDPSEMKYVHLVDGGVADNLGLSTIMALRAASGSAIAPLSPEDSVRVRHLTFLVVNAEMVRDATWPLTAAGPNGVQAASASLDAAMDSGKRGAYDGFVSTMAKWESDVRAYRCGLKKDDVVRLRGTLDGWKCGDVIFTVDMISFADLPADQREKLGLEPTRVSLPAASIDALIAGGKQAVKQNAAARAAAR